MISIDVVKQALGQSIGNRPSLANLVGHLNQINFNVDQALTCAQAAATHLTNQGANPDTILRSTVDVYEAVAYCQAFEAGAVARQTDTYHNTAVTTANNILKLMQQGSTTHHQGTPAGGQAGNPFAAKPAQTQQAGNPFAVKSVQAQEPSNPFATTQAAPAATIFAEPQPVATPVAVAPTPEKRKVEKYIDHELMNELAAAGPDVREIEKRALWYIETDDGALDVQSILSRENDLSNSDKPFVLEVETLGTSYCLAEHPGDKEVTDLTELADMFTSFNIKVKGIVTDTNEQMMDGISEALQAASDITDTCRVKAASLKGWRRRVLLRAGVALRNLTVDVVNRALLYCYPDGYVDSGKEHYITLDDNPACKEFASLVELLNVEGQTYGGELELTKFLTVTHRYLTTINITFVDDVTLHIGNDVLTCTLNNRLDVPVSGSTGTVELNGDDKSLRVSARILESIIDIHAARFPNTLVRVIDINDVQLFIDSIEGDYVRLFDH